MLLRGNDHVAGRAAAAPGGGGRDGVPQPRRSRVSMRPGPCIRQMPRNHGVSWCFAPGLALLELELAPAVRCPPASRLRGTNRMTPPTPSSRGSHRASRNPPFVRMCLSFWPYHRRGPAAYVLRHVDGPLALYTAGGRITALGAWWCAQTGVGFSRWAVTAAMVDLAVKLGGRCVRRDAAPSARSPSAWMAAVASQRSGSSQRR
jgi:hypothetical protein